VAMRQTALENKFVPPDNCRYLELRFQGGLAMLRIPQRSFKLLIQRKGPVVRSAPAASRFGRSIARLEKCRSGHVVFISRIAGAGSSPLARPSVDAPDVQN